MRGPLAAISIADAGRGVGRTRAPSSSTKRPRRLTVSPRQSAAHDASSISSSHSMRSPGAATGRPKRASIGWSPGETRKRRRPGAIRSAVATACASRAAFQWWAMRIEPIWMRRVAIEQRDRHASSRRARRPRCARRASRDRRRRRPRRSRAPRRAAPARAAPPTDARASRARPRASREQRPRGARRAPARARSSRPRARRSRPARAPRRAACAAPRSARRRRDCGAPRSRSNAAKRWMRSSVKPGVVQIAPRSHQAPGPLPGLFRELARGAGFRRLAGVELAGRHLEDHAAGRMPVLADQSTSSLGHEGHDGGRARMAHDVELEQRPVRELDALAGGFDAKASSHGLCVRELSRGTLARRLARKLARELATGLARGLAGRRHVSEGSPDGELAMPGLPLERSVADRLRGPRSRARRRLPRRAGRLGRGRRGDRSAPSRCTAAACSRPS